ncbi:MAG TPA: helix-turn-helix transcriptional regulator [Herpetosiphonaceae bacterium]
MTASNRLKLLAERIKQTRHDLGLTQKELADRAGITQEMIRRYENGQQEPRPSTLHILAEVLWLQAYELAKECGFPQDYCDAIERRDSVSLMQKTPLFSPTQHPVFSVIEDGVRLQRHGDIEGAQALAKKALGIIDRERRSGNLRLAEFLALDLWLDTETRSRAGDLRECEQIARETVEFAKDEFGPKGLDLSNDYIARAKLRLADTLLLQGRFLSSYEEAHEALSLARTPATRKELFRVLVHVLEHEGPTNELAKMIRRALAEIERTPDDSHETGCLLQRLGVTEAKLHQRSGLLILEKAKKWYDAASNRGFQDHLVETLIYTRWAHALAQTGPYHDPKAAMAVAQHGCKLAVGKYFRLLEECQLILRSGGALA